MMTQDQVKFKQFIETHVPAFAELFDWKKRELIFSRLDSYLENASSGEDMIARFFAGVWLHNNKYEFDMISAVKRLDTRKLNIIYKWLDNPIWP